MGGKEKEEAALHWETSILLKPVCLLLLLLLEALWTSDSSVFSLSAFMLLGLSREHQGLSLELDLHSVLRLVLRLLTVSTKHLLDPLIWSSEHILYLQLWI